VGEDRRGGTPTSVGSPPTPNPSPQGGGESPSPSPFAQTAALATRLISEAFAAIDHDDIRTLTAKDALLPHTLAALDHTPAAGPDAAWSGYLADETGSWQFIRGDAPGALANFEKSLGIREKLAASDPGRVQWQTDVVVSCCKIAGAGGEPRANYLKALNILQRLDGEGRLPGAQKSWIPAIEGELAKLDGGGASAAIAAKAPAPAKTGWLARLMGRG